jgi:hypothetical protein
LYGDYKIHDYMSGMGHNEEYWDMFAKEKNTQG